MELHLPFPEEETPTVTVRHGDCLTILRDLPDNSVDSVVTDPPYGLSNTKPAQVADVLAAWVTGDTEAVPAKNGGFMGADWDSFVPPPAVWTECLRVLKPGGHMAVFAGARTQDLMGLSIRLAGFEIRDTLGWIYGSGFPKSMDVSKAIDKAERGSLVRMKMLAAAQNRGIDGKYLEKCGVASAASWADWTIGGHVPSDKNWEIVKDALGIAAEEEAEFERKILARKSSGIAVGTGQHAGNDGVYGYAEDFDITAPATSAAKQWSGWGTALKPAIEPIILARKPLDGTVAANVLAHGVGGLNIDASRVGQKFELTPQRGNVPGGVSLNMSVTGMPADAEPTVATGRFPANVLLDEHAAKEMDRQSGDSVSRKGAPRRSQSTGDGYGMTHTGAEYNDQGGVSRFFPVFKYQAKAPKKERPVIVREDGTKVQHPTVKPLSLMSWIVALITPPGGTVLDPFAGTGTTLQAARDKGFNAIGVEQDADYLLMRIRQVTIRALVSY